MYTFLSIRPENGSNWTNKNDLKFHNDFLDRMEMSTETLKRKMGVRRKTSMLKVMAELALTNWDEKTKHQTQNQFNSCKWWVLMNALMNLDWGDPTGSFGGNRIWTSWEVISKNTSEDSGLSGFRYLNSKLWCSYWKLFSDSFSAKTSTSW